MMEIRKDEEGFFLSSEDTEFFFCTDACLPEDSFGGVFALNACDVVPTPEIMPKDRLLLPVDEGIAVEADKEYLSGEFDSDCITGRFSGREGTLSMVIVQRGAKYLLIMLEDGIHARYEAKRKNGLYRLNIYSGKEQKAIYGIFDSLTEACKFYGKVRNKKFLSLEDKIKLTPKLEKLVGGGIFWVWNDNYDEVMYSDCDTDVSPAVGENLLEIAGDLHKNGVKNALFGIFFNEDSPLSEKLDSEYGYLTTQYDNYNDVLNPALLKIIPNNRVKNCDYTYRRMKDYPEGILKGKDGSLAKAWELKGFDGKMYSQNCLCPAVAAKRMKTEIAEILKEFPKYSGRFIDVFGNGLSECYDERHPLTTEECLTVKREAFEAVRKMGLITGTEDLTEDIIDGLDYSEGLHSPIYFRINNAGRNHAHIYSPEQALHIRQHMLNPECRVPLWQLVHHENLVAFPYWGDSTEMSPSDVKDKILFAVLYGCAPLYSFTVKDYDKLKNVILSSYEKITSVHKIVARLPMSDFEILSDDYMLQRSVFGDRYEVVANFSEDEKAFFDKTVSAKDFYFGEVKK